MGGSAFSYLKASLDAMMQSEDLLAREAAISCFGCVGNFCLAEVKQSLGPLLAFLLANCESPEPFLK